MVIQATIQGAQTCCSRIHDSICRLIVLDELWGTWNSVDRDEAQQIYRGYTGIALTQMRTSLLNEVMLILCRLFDNSDNKTGKERASFKRMVWFLEQSEISLHLPQRAAEWSAHTTYLGDDEEDPNVQTALRSMQSQFATEDMGRVQTAIQQFSEKIRFIESEEPNRIARIIAFRNKHLAHDLINESETEVTVRDVRSLVGDVETLGKDSYLIFAGTSTDYGNLRYEASAGVQSVWKLLVKGSAATEAERLAKRSSRFGVISA